MLKEQIGEMSQQIAIQLIMIRKRDAKILEQEDTINNRLAALEGK